MFLHPILFLCLFGVGNAKDCQPKECKIDACASRDYGNFIWNVINSGETTAENLKLCSRDNLCIWILSSTLCQRFYEEFPRIAKFSKPKEVCQYLNSKDEKRLRVLAFAELSSFRHPQETRIFLPVFGVAFILLLFWIWCQEAIEECVKLQRNSAIKEKTNSIVHFDKCDSCVSIISSETKLKTRLHSTSFEDQEEGMPSPGALHDLIIASGYHEMKRTLDKKRLRETSNDCTAASQSLPALPHLILETKRPIETLCPRPGPKGILRKNQLQVSRISNPETDKGTTAQQKLDLSLGTPKFFCRSNFSHQNSTQLLKKPQKTLKSNPVKSDPKERSFNSCVSEVHKTFVKISEEKSPPQIGQSKVGRISSDVTVQAPEMETDPGAKQLATKNAGTQTQNAQESPQNSQKSPIKELDCLSPSFDSSNLGLKAFESGWKVLLRLQCG